VVGQPSLHLDRLLIRIWNAYSALCVVAVVAWVVGCLVLLLMEAIPC
jgi:hypothetical protein